MYTKNTSFFIKKKKLTTQNLKNICVEVDLFGK